MTLILDLVQEKWKEQKRPKKFQNEKKKLLDSTHYLIRDFLSKGNLENGGTFLQKSFVEKCFKMEHPSSCKDQSSMKSN